MTFTSHIDGSTHRFTPERSIGIQEQLGADVILAFDECTSPLADYAYTRQAMERTHRWAERCAAAHTTPQALFGIVQGGEYQDLREESARFIGGLPFDGVAIGGSLGKSKADMHARARLDRAGSCRRPGRAICSASASRRTCSRQSRGASTCSTAWRRRGSAATAMVYVPDGRLHILNAAYREDPAPVEAGCAVLHVRAFFARVFAAPVRGERNARAPGWRRFTTCSF